MSYTTSGYYKLPLNTKRLISNEELDKVDLKKSVKSYLNLLMTTHYGECMFNESFGCIIWDIDFDNLTKTSKLKEEMAFSLRESITENEARLKSVRVDLKVTQHEFLGQEKLTRVKKRLEVKVSATLRQTNESFFCTEQFYIAPLSY